MVGGKQKKISSLTDACHINPSNYIKKIIRREQSAPTEKLSGNVNSFLLKRSRKHGPI